MDPRPFGPESVTSSGTIYWGGIYNPGDDVLTAPDDIATWLSDYGAEWPDNPDPETMGSTTYCRFDIPISGETAWARFHYPAISLDRTTMASEPTPLRVLLVCTWSPFYTTGHFEGFLRFSGTSTYFLVMNDSVDPEGRFPEIIGGTYPVTSGEWPPYDFSFAPTDFVAGEYETLLNQIEAGTAYIEISGHTIDADINFLDVMVEDIVLNVLYAPPPPSLRTLPGRRLFAPR